MEHVENKLLLILNIAFWTISIVGFLGALAGAFVVGTPLVAASLLILDRELGSGIGFFVIIAIIIFAIVGILAGIVLVLINYIVYLCLKSYIELIKLNRTQAEKLTELLQKQSS